MALPSRRGLQDIRTLAGIVKKATLPHEAYMRLSHIEIEKTRKTLERERARKLVADITARLQEIEAQKKALLQVIQEGGGAPGPVRTGPPRSTGGLKIIRY